MDVSAKIYKWVGQDGQVHYGQQPPSGVDAEPMSVDSAPPSSGSGGSAKGNAGAGQDSGTDQAESGDAGADDAISKNCKMARQNLSVLENAGPEGRYTGPDGKVVEYDEDQWQSKVDQNKGYIENFCQDE
jgi:hypothetical protein